MNSALPSEPMPLTDLSLLMLLFHLCLGLQNIHLSSEYPNKHLYVFLCPISVKYPSDVIVCYLIN